MGVDEHTGSSELHIVQKELKKISNSVTDEFECVYNGQFTAIKKGDEWHIRANVLGVPCEQNPLAIFHMSDPEFFDKMKAELVRIIGGEYGKCGWSDTWKNEMDEMEP